MARKTTQELWDRANHTSVWAVGAWSGLLPLHQQEVGRFEEVVRADERAAIATETSDGRNTYPDPVALATAHAKAVRAMTTTTARYKCRGELFRECCHIEYPDALDQWPWEKLSKHQQSGWKVAAVEFLRRIDERDGTSA